MSIKGFPSSQKLPLGTGITNEFATVVPSDKYRYSLDVNRPLFRVDSAVAPRTAAANTGNIDGMTWVYDTSTPALKGDFVRFETGNAQYIEVPIVKVETNRFMLGALVSPAPAAGDTFYILRSVSPLVGSDGTASITASNPSVGTNNSTAPISSTEMGFIDGTGKLQGVSATNPLPMVASSLPLPSGAATAARQDTGNNSLSSIDGKLATLGQKAMAGSMPVTIASDQSSILTRSVSNDILGVQVTGQQYNQIEINLETIPSTALLTRTTTSTGTIVASGGHSLFSTGTGTTASAKAVTVQTNIYRPLHQAYGSFTASWTTPTSADSYQRIGLYDTNNGFFISYEGLTFGVTVRSGAVDTFIPRGSWNTDLLTGAAGSKFTRNGVPEAINLNLSNLWRIRFAWLGSANIFFETFSPDGEWVLFHNIKQPNTSINPSIQIPNLPMTLNIAKTSSDATNLVMTSACWAAGTTSTLVKITDTLTDYSLATVNRSVITGVTTGGGGGYVNVKVNPSGALVADVTGTVAATQSGTWAVGLNAGTNLVGKVGIDQTTNGTTNAVYVNNFPATQPVSGTFWQATQPVSGTFWQATQPVSVAALPATTGRAKVGQLFNDYTTTNVTTAAYVQLTASTAATVNQIEIFDSSGEALILAVGAATSEVDQLYIFPGGNGPVQLAIPASSRISVKAKTATASAGFLAINLYS